MAYVIINKTGLFTRWVLDWNTKPQVQKIWTNFKTHFCKAQQQLRETTWVQQYQTNFRANTVQEILTELKQELRNNLIPQDNGTVDNSIPNMSTISNDVSSTISALQTELSTQKEVVNNMFQPTPPPAPSFTQPWFLPNPHAYAQMYCQQVTPPTGQMQMVHNPSQATQPTQSSGTPTETPLHLLLLNTWCLLPFKWSLHEQGTRTSTYS